MLAGPQPSRAPCGVQLKALRLPGPAQHREPPRPMGTTPGSAPIPALSSPLALQFVSWLYSGSLSIQLKRPACWPRWQRR